MFHVLTPSALIATGKQSCPGYFERTRAGCRLCMHLFVNITGNQAISLQLGTSFHIKR